MIHFPVISPRASLNTDTEGRVVKERVCGANTTYGWSYLLRVRSIQKLIKL